MSEVQLKESYFDSQLLSKGERLHVMKVLLAISLRWYRDHTARDREHEMPH